MEEAKELSDRIGIMKDGHLLEVGTVEELNLKSGNDDFEKTFISIVKEASIWRLWRLLKDVQKRFYVIH